MSRVRYTVDTRNVDRELSRLADAPGPRTAGQLEAVLTGLFQETQISVHVITGSLRASGKIRSDFRGGHTWRGEIRYGGAAPGAVHDPVRYAWYEQRRGATHDFLRTVEGTDSFYVRAMLDELRGEAA